MRLSGNWYIERQMHDGRWEIFAQGYASAESAKAACKYHAPMAPNTANFRVSNDDGSGYKATLTSSARARWTRNA